MKAKEQAEQNELFRLILFQMDEVELNLLYTDCPLNNTNLLPAYDKILRVARHNPACASGGFPLEEIREEGESPPPMVQGQGDQGQGFAGASASSSSTTPAPALSYGLQGTGFGSTARADDEPPTQTLASLRLSSQGSQMGFGGSASSSHASDLQNLAHFKDGSGVAAAASHIMQQDAILNPQLAVSPQTVQ